jgi:hypothetical protein
MKKIMSLILAVLCVTLTALPLSVSAEVADLKLSNYVSGYTASGATSWNSADSATFNNDGTELNIKHAVGKNAGFTVDLSKLGVVANSNESYTIRFTLKSKVTEEMSSAHAGSVTNASQMRYMYMAFPNSALGATGGTALDGGNNTCPRIQWAKTHVSVTMPGNQENTYEGSAEKLSESLRNETETTFTLTVEDGKWTSITVSDGINAMKTVFDTDVSATSTYFAFCYRCDWQNVKPLYATEAVLTSFTITKEANDDVAENLAVLGGQLSNDNSTFRILSNIAVSEEQLEGYTSHGFEISLKGSSKGAKTLESTTVYTSVQAAGDTVTATNGYLGAMTVTGLTAGQEYTFVVRAFIIDASGNKYMSAAVEISTADA